MKLSKTKVAVISLIIANIIWGAASPIYKWALQDVAPFTFGLLRFLIAVCILIPFVSHKLLIQKKDVPKLVILALLGITVNIGFLLVGLTMSNSVNAPVIGAAAPVFIVLGSLAFLKENLKMRVLIGTLLSLVGVLVVILRPLFEPHIQSSIVGNIFFAISTLANVGYTLMLRSIAKKYDPLVLTFWVFFIGTIGFIPFFFYEYSTGATLLTLQFKSIFGISYAAILSSVAAYGMFTYALKYLIASKVGVFLYMDPIVAILVAVPLLGESITYFFFLGAVLVFLGIFIAEGRIHYHPFHLLSRKD